MKNKILELIDKKIAQLHTLHNDLNNCLQIDILVELRQEIEAMEERDESQWILVTERLPEKGKEVEVACIYDVYRCNCGNKYCQDWRESMSGLGMIISPKLWREKPLPPHP